MAPALANVAMIGILQERHIRNTNANVAAEQLQRTLDLRILIERVTGPLAVLPIDVVYAVDGRFAADAGMGSVVMISVHPGVVGGGACRV